MLSDLASSPAWRWLAVTAGVAGVHALALHSWQGTPQDRADHRPEAQAWVSGVLLPPVLPPPAAPSRAPTTAAVDSPLEPAAPAAPAAPVATGAASGTAELEATPSPEALPQVPDTLAAAAPPHPVAEAAPPPAPPQAMPPAVDTQWEYEVNGLAKGFRYSATATMRWQTAAQRYEVHLSLGAFLVGSRSQSSQGRIGPEGLVPESFMDKARRERELRFDWSQHSLQSPEQPGGRALKPGTQDRLSVFMQLASLLAALPHAPQAGQHWTFAVAGFNQTEPWVFTYRGTENLDLPAGTMSAWKLTREAQQADGEQAELWFSPDFHHLPVRIRISQGNGDVVDQRLSRR